MEPTSWKIVNLLDDFYDVEHIMVLKNNEKILDLKFEDLEFKNKFIYYNSALDNSSLLLK
jgi:hypothetical protein